MEISAPPRALKTTSRQHLGLGANAQVPVDVDIVAPEIAVGVARAFHRRQEQQSPGPLLIDALHTPRLRIRPWSGADPDVSAWFAMYGDSEVTRYIGGTTMLDVRAARSFLTDRLAVFQALPAGLGAGAIVRHEDGAIVGSALIKPLPGADRSTPSGHIEIGWHLARTHWGHGYATEAGQALATHAFTTLGLDHVLAVVEPPNTASQAVARRLGMRRLGRSREFYGGLEADVFRLDAVPPE